MMGPRSWSKSNSMLSQALPYQVATYRIGILIATVKEELLSSIGNSGNNSTSNDGTKDNELTLWLLNLIRMMIFRIHQIIKRDDLF